MCKIFALTIVLVAFFTYNGKKSIFQMLNVRYLQYYLNWFIIILCAKCSRDHWRETHQVKIFKKIHEKFKLII